MFYMGFWNVKLVCVVDDVFFVEFVCYFVKNYCFRGILNNFFGGMDVIE